MQKPFSLKIRKKLLTNAVTEWELTTFGSMQMHW